MQLHKLTNMKKTLLIGLLVVTAIFTGCNKGEEDEPLTESDNKAMIQDIGVEFVNEMSAMQDLESVSVLTSLGSKLTSLEDDEEFPDKAHLNNSAVTRITKSITAVAYQKTSAKRFGKYTTKVALDKNEDDYESLEELFDDNTGTYSWNSDIEDFDFEDNSDDEVIFEFPSEEDGTTNNAVLTLSNYTSVQVSNPIEEEYEGDLPTSLDVTLTVDGTELIAYGFEIDYTNEGYPETVNTQLDIEGYSLAVSTTHTNTKVSSSVSYKHDSKVLIATTYELNGNFSDSNLEENEELEDPTEVITDGSFTLTLLDLKFSADLDFAALYDETEDLEGYYDPYYDDVRPDLEGNAEKLESALNESGSLKATYVSTGKTAADVEFYTFLDGDDEYGDEWIEIGARMIFEDGSKVDVEDFLESGFDGLESSLNDLIDDINSELGLEGDDEIEHIDFSDLN